MKNYHEINSIVIGGGPAGMSAAIYLARYLHPVTILDAPDKVHGRTGMATSLENFLGHQTKMSGSDFLAGIKKQAAKYPDISYQTQLVTKVSYDDQKKIFAVATEKQTFYAQYVIIAVGLKDLMPPVPGKDPYYDSSIFHCVTCDWHQHRHQKALVISNNDRGLTAALAINARFRPPYLAVVAGKPEPTFSPERLIRAKAAKIPVFDQPLASLQGQNGHLQAVTLADGTALEAEVLFTQMGHKRLDTFLDAGGIKIERDEEEFIKVNFATFESSLPNLFAVGPCNQGPDQAIIAAGQGATAALEIHERILDEMGI